MRLRHRAFAVNGVDYEPDENKAYFTFEMLHSFPVVNGNGVSFAANTINRSAETAIYNEINFEHKSEGNGIPLFDGSQIIGTMIDAAPGEPDENGSIPLNVVGVLWKRHERARDVIADMESGENEWKISMEVLFSLSGSGFMSGGEYLDYSKELFEVWEKGENHNGNPLVFMIGGNGESGEGPNVNFWGSAVTMKPADENAKIHSLVASKNIKQALAQQGYRMVVASNGTPESTVLYVDGAEAENLRSVEMWSVNDKEYSWFDFGYSLQPEQKAGFERTQYFQFTGSKIEEVEMSKMEELQATIAKLDALKDLPDSLKAQLDELKSGVAAIGDEFVPKADVDRLVQEKADEMLKAEKEKSERITARLQEWKKSLSDAGFKVTAAREKVLTGFAEIEAESDSKKAFDAYMEDLKAGVESMEAKLVESGVNVDEKIRSEIAMFDSPESEGFTGYITALGRIKSTNGGFTPDNDNGHNDKGNEKPRFSGIF